MSETSRSCSLRNSGGGDSAAMWLANVACRFSTMTGTNTGPFELFGLPPTGRPVTMTGQEVFRFDGKQFIEVWHQEDVPTMLQQLGLQPPPIVMRLAARQSAWRYRHGR